MKIKSSLWQGCAFAALVTFGTNLSGVDGWEQLADGPGGRAYHTAIFTGDEIIVWGGGRDGVFLGDGGVFNLQHKRWGAVSLNGAPRGRWFQGAVWTGTEMIIWGGRPNFYFFNHSTDGGRYDPGGNRWSSMSQVNAPSPRSQFATVWTGSEMIVWGGMGDGATELATGGRYNPATDTWRTLPPCPLQGRFEPSAVWTGSEMIVFGGAKIDNYLGNEFWSSFGDGARYNPSTDQWTLLNPQGAASSRTVHTAVWTGTEMLIWGGRSLPSTVPMQTGASYNPATDLWTPISMTGAPDPRAGAAAVWTGDEMIVWGGWNTSNRPMNSGGRYNPISRTWAPTTFQNAPAARFFNHPHSAVWTGDAMFIYAGFDYPISLNSAHFYYPWSGAEAVEALLLALDSLNLPRKSERPLAAALEAALHSLTEGNEQAAANQLEAFQRKVEMQLGRQDPGLAKNLIAAAQAIIDRID